MNLFKNMSPYAKYVLTETLRVSACLAAIEVGRRVIISGTHVVLGNR